MPPPPADLPRFDRPNQCIWRGDRRIELAANAFRVLDYLVERPNQLVPKSALLDAIWPDSYVVDAVLSVAVSQLREALGDDPRQPHFIETVHRRGYRWIGTLATDSAPITAPIATPPPSTHAAAPAAAAVAPLEPTARDVADPSATIVGRDAALAELTAAATRAAAGKRQLVFVTGEPGIGKTTLLDHFLASPAARDALVARGQCIDAYGLGEAYMPLLEALQEVVRRSSDVLDVLRRQAPTWLLQLPGHLSAAEHDELQRSLASSTGARMVRELQQAIEALTAERTIVLVLEDLHWSDPATVAALAGLALRREPARLLVVCTYRPVDAIAELHPVVQLKHDLTAKRQCVEIALDGLHVEAVDAYLATRFGRGTLSAEIAQRLFVQTAGNPLFLLNAVEDLEQRRWLECVDGTWRCTVAPERLADAVPESTRAMIDSRLTRLPAECLTMLEAASVIGPSFASQTLAAALDRDAADVEHDCTTLARAGRFVREIEAAHWPDGTSGAQYAFRHALYQQVLHGRVTAARRQTLHRSIAGRLERGFGDAAVDIAGALALHYELGGDLERAVVHHLRAAQVARGRYSYEQAIAQFRHGLALLRRIPAGDARDAREIELQSELIACIFSTDGPGAAEIAEIAVRIDTLTKTGETTLALLNSLIGLTAFCITRGDLQRAEEACERTLQRAASVEWGAFFANVARGLTGFTQYRRGRLNAAIPNLTIGAALPVLGASSMMEPSLGCASDLAFTLVLQGELARGLALLRDVDARADATGHPPTIVYSTSNVMRIGQMLGDRTLLEQVAVKMGEIGERLVSPRFLAYRLLCEGSLGIDAGDPDGVARLREGARLLADANHLVYAPFYAEQAAAGLLRLGRVDEAQDALEEAFALLDATDARWCEPELHRLRGEIVLARAAELRVKSKAHEQAMRSAEGCFRRAVDVAREQGARWWETGSLSSLVRLLPSGKDRTTALRQLAELHTALDDGADVPALRAVRALLGAQRA
jgi:DNA-binding winged helix-turn-helix (wHTH) protein/tetratricopeptide (TPR) repeat protein